MFPLGLDVVAVKHHRVWLEDASDNDDVNDENVSGDMYTVGTDTLSQQ